MADTTPLTPTTNAAAGGDWWSQNAPPSVTGTSGQGTGTATNLPEFTPNMSEDQVRQAANAYIAASGLPNIDNGQYWVDQYKQFGSGDPNYFKTKLLNGIHGNGGKMDAFGPPSPSDPGGWGPGTAGYGGGSAGGGAPGAAPGPWGAFQAPTMEDFQKDPGLQARLKMGTDALQASAAAKGSLLSGGTLKALDRYAQDYASNEYGNVFGRAATGYGLTQGGANAYANLLGQQQQLGLGATKFGYQPAG